MNRILNYCITKEFHGYTVSSYLKHQGFTHSQFVQLKKTPNAIMRNNIWLYTSDLLYENDLLEINLTEDETLNEIVPVCFPFDILYEDEDILLVNKPCNMPVHPSIANYDNTLANAVTYYYKQKSEAFVFRCLNRLDRDTTGILLVAKNSLASAILSSDIKNRKIKREYLCIVDGIMAKEGTIDAPIARKTDSILERIVDYDHGETAITHYRQLQANQSLSLLQVTLETGRTHQIRVHMKHIGHPLIGDFLYHPDFSKIKRQSLHSARLSFVHPISKQWMDFYAPLPKDMSTLFPDFNFNQWRDSHNTQEFLA